MEAFVEHADGRWWRVLLHKHRLGDEHGLVAHAALDLAAFAVDGVQRVGQLAGAGGVVGQQAFDAQRHVGQPASGVDAGAECKTEIEGGGHRGLAAGGDEQGLHAHGQGAGADAFEALGHQAAVVGVEFHHVGHGAQGDEGQQAVELGLGHASPLVARQT